ncbi:MAG: hypothetical protein ACU0AT_05295 [Tranquillimonas sp.]
MKLTCAGILAALIASPATATPVEPQVTPKGKGFILTYDWADEPLIANYVFELDRPVTKLDFRYRNPDMPRTELQGPVITLTKWNDDGTLAWTREHVGYACNAGNYRSRRYPDGPLWIIFDLQGGCGFFEREWADLPVTQRAGNMPGGFGSGTFNLSFDRGELPDFGTAKITVNVVPLPATAALLAGALGLLGFTGAARRGVRRRA